MEADLLRSSDRGQEVRLEHIGEINTRLRHTWIRDRLQIFLVQLVVGALVVSRTRVVDLEGDLIRRRLRVRKQPPACPDKLPINGIQDQSPTFQTLKPLPKLASPAASAANTNVARILNAVDAARVRVQDV